MPRGPTYFHDAAHFTSAGEHTASRMIYQYLTHSPLLAEQRRSHDEPPITNGRGAQ
jgi:hypothetical protein